MGALRPSKGMKTNAPGVHMSVSMGALCPSKGMKTNAPGVHMSVSMGALCPSKGMKTNAPGVHMSVNAASKSACATSEIETIACFRRCERGTQEWVRHMMLTIGRWKLWRELQLAASRLISTPFQELE